MRRIAIINQKGGVGKTTTSVNLGAALARAGKRVVVVDLDAQANATMHLGIDLDPGDPSTYGILCGNLPVADALRPTSTPGLSLVPSHIDLSGAELELASAIGRETILRDALKAWEAGGGEADYVLFDCPPSLGLLSVNGLCAAHDVIVVLQTEFFALQGLSKLIEIVQLLRSRLNPELQLAGVLPCLYDSRLRLGREVLGEIRRYFSEQVLSPAIRTNVKLAEAPSHGQTIFEYDPTSTGARDYAGLAEELLRRHEDERPPPSDEPEAAEVAALERRLARMSREVRAKPAEEQGGAQPPSPTGPAGAGFGAGVAVDAADADPGAGAGPSEPQPAEEPHVEVLPEVEIPRPDPEEPPLETSLGESADQEPVGGPYVHPIIPTDPDAGGGLTGPATDQQSGTTLTATSFDLVARDVPSDLVESVPASPPVESGTAAASEEVLHPQGPDTSPGAQRAIKLASSDSGLGHSGTLELEPALDPSPSATPATIETGNGPTADTPGATKAERNSPELDTKSPASEEQADPLPTGALAPRGQNFYIGEDREHLASSRGPWAGRSLDDRKI